MNLNQLLWNLQHIHTGSWGLPDFGVTEALASGTGAGTTSQGGSNLIGPSDAQTTGGGGGTQTPAPTTPPGGSTYTAPTTPSAPTAPAQVDRGPDLALQAWNAARQQAQDIRNSGQNTFDTLMKSIGAYRDRAKTLFDNAGQEITNNASDILGTNANNAQQLVGKSTGQARSLGLGLSSRVNLGQGLLNNLGVTQGNTIAKRGEQNRSNQVDYQGKQDTADTQTSQAQQYLKDIQDSASAVESSGVNNYGTALNNVLNYQRALSAINPLQANNLTAYSPDFSGIVSTLNGILGNPTSTAPTAAISNPASVAAANPVSPTTIADLLKRQQGLYTG